jgi:SAM-dependent methyltransferase
LSPSQSSVVRYRIQPLLYRRTSISGGDGIPVLLDEGPQTLWVAGSSLRHARQPEEYAARDPYHLDTMIAPDQQGQFRELLSKPDHLIDPIVSIMVGATNGIAYLHLVGKLGEYPIPRLRLPPARGQVLLDVGCNWGRWSIAAARLGYKPIGIDPSLGAVLAAKRVATQLGLDLRFVVGDARSLPFRSGSFDAVFSYSVIQHFSKDDAIQAIQEIGRTLAVNGRSLVQMPTILGVRCLYHQVRRRFREARDFEVRYWSIPALRRVFHAYVGRTAVSIDCFFGIGLQPSDLHLMPLSHKIAIRASELLRAGSRLAPWLRYVADSVYLERTKAA